MRILLVGGSGFVGRHFLEVGRRPGDSIVATYRPGETVVPVDGCEWIAADVLDGPGVTGAVAAAAPDAVVHLAGQADVARANRDPVGTFRVNAEGTMRVLDAVRRGAPRARVVVVTSAEVYGAVPPEAMPVDETRVPAPRTPYGVSKAAADLIAAQAGPVWGLSVLRMRPFNHVGPGQRLGFVAPDFAAQVAAAERGLAPPVIHVGNLSGRRDFTDVRDIVAAYRLALEKGTPGEAYNLCSGRSVAIEEILRFFVDRARIAIEIRPDERRLRPVEVSEFRGDGRRAANDLGWKPRIGLEQSLGEVLEEWRRAPDHALPAAD